MTSTLFSPEEAFSNQTIRCIPTGNSVGTKQHNVCKKLNCKFNPTLLILILLVLVFFK